MSFLTIIHVAGGSTVEAAQTAAVVGPFKTLEEAEQAGDKVHEGVKHVDFLNQECFHSIVELPRHAVTPGMVIQDLLNEYDDDTPNEEAIEIHGISFEELEQILLKQIDDL